MPLVPGLNISGRHLMVVKINEKWEMTSLSSHPQKTWQNCKNKGAVPPYHDPLLTKRNQQLLLNHQFLKGYYPGFIFNA